MRGADKKETFRGRSIVRWQLLPSVSHQSVSEGQWRQYYDERRTIELDGLGANHPDMEETEHADRDPRAEAMLESVRGRVEDVLRECGYDSISYQRSIQELVYLLPFVGDQNGNDPRTIAMATVLYSPYETINYVTLSYEHHHKTNISTMTCEQSDGTEVRLIELVKVGGETTVRRLASEDSLLRTRHFVFGANAENMSAWTVLDLLLCAAAFGELGEDSSWIRRAGLREYSLHPDDTEMLSENTTILARKVQELREEGKHCSFTSKGD